MYASGGSVEEIYFAVTHYYMSRAIHASSSPAMRAAPIKLNALVAFSACCVRDEASTAPFEAAFVDQKDHRQVMGLQL